jgi:hypothetical protein
MSNPTSNFNWQMPTNTDLVSQLPADFEVFGQAVDTSLADLLGGTTGQVLKKNSDTNMDFVWSADAAGMTNPMTTTGDTIYSSSGSTPARLAIGTSGQVMTVSGGGVPSWATATSGGMTLLASGSISSDPTTISSISQDYKELVFYAIDWKSGSANNTYVRFNGDGNANYYTVQVTQNNTIFSSGVGVAQTAASVIGPDRGTVNDNNLVLRIPNYTAAAYKVASAISFITNDGNTTFGTTNTTIGYKSTTAISSLSITTCTSGSYELYGVK